MGFLSKKFENSPFDVFRTRLTVLEIQDCKTKVIKCLVVLVYQENNIKLKSAHSKILTMLKFLKTLDYLTI